MARLSSPLEGEGQYARQRLSMMALIPAAPSHAYNRRVACQRRDVDRSVLHVAATGAWKESLTEGSRSRRPGLTGIGEAPVMAGSRCPPSVAQGAIAKLRRGVEREAKVWPTPQIAERGCRKATPGTVRSQRAARLSRRPARVSWGRNRPRGCRVGTRVPFFVADICGEQASGRNCA